MASYRDTVLATPGLVSLWDLDEPSGLYADSADSNPGTNNGTISREQPSLLLTEEGKSIKPNGTTGYVSIANSANLEIADTLTLEAWVKPTGDEGNNEIIALAPNQAEMKIEGSLLKLGKAGVANIVQSTVKLDTNAHHVAATKSGATSKLYIDGVDVTGSVVNQTLEKASGTKAIGRYSASALAFFHGNIQYAAVYNVALSAEQITAHYVAGFTSIPIPPPPGGIRLFAIAEGGRGRGFDLTGEAAGLQWSSVNPGGDETCTFTVNRSWFAENPEISKGNLIRVTAGIDVLWQGRIEEIDRAMGDAESLTITAYGLGNRLGDVTFSEIYAERDLSRFGEVSTSMIKQWLEEGWNISSGQIQPDSGGNPSLRLAIQEPWEKGARSAMLYRAPPNCEIAEMRFSRQKGGGDNYTWSAYLLSEDRFGAILATATGELNTPVSNKSLAVNGAYLAHLELAASVAASSGNETSDNYLGVRLFGPHGLAKQGTEPLEGFSADQIVGHILQQANGIAARHIDPFAYIITQLVFDVSITPKDAIPQVNEFANADYGTWGPNSPLDNSLNGFFDYTQPDSTTPHWFATRKDFDGDLNFHTETSSLYDTVDVSYVDEAGASHTERFSIISPDLKEADLSPRVFPLDLGVTTKANAQIRGEIFLNLFAGFAPARGSGVLSGTLQHHQRGELHAFYARADGSNIRIPDILPAETTFALDATPDRRTAFPIKRVNVDASGPIPKTSIEFDQTNDSLALLLAQETAQAALVG